MSLAIPITKGRVAEPDRILITGVPKAGKTTFAAGAPEPYIIDVNRGSGNFDQFTRVQPTTRDQLYEAIDAMPDYCRTLVIDTLGDVERLFFDYICAQAGVDSIEAVGGGFGKGVTRSVEEWQHLLLYLDKVRARRGCEVILISHLIITAAINPTGADYSKYELSVNKKSAPVIYGWCDTIGFADFEGSVNKDDKVSFSGRRVLRLSRGGFEAGSRYKIPATLPLEYAAYAAARAEGGFKGPDDLYVEAVRMANEVGGEKLADRLAAIEKARTNANALQKWIDTLRTQLVTNPNQGVAS